MSHTWLRHRDHGGYWQCPDGAVEDMAELGWDPVDPATIPPEPNPATAERLAWEAEQAATTSAPQAEQSQPDAASRGKSE